MSTRKVLLLVGLHFYTSRCMRTHVKLHARLSQSRSTSALHFRPGDVFDKRFKLQELIRTPVPVDTVALETQGNESATSLVQQDRAIPLPNMVLDSYEQPPEYLGKGSFGETWKAYDSHLQANVAVKMLYTGSPARHVSWARDGGNMHMKVELEKASHECSLAQMMQTEAQKDPKGASRLMRCIEDHVGSERNSYDPLYLVLEFCGNNDLQTFIEGRFKEDTLTMAELQSVWEQLNEGLNYMTNDAHTRRWVHHDLKSANIVVDESQGHETPLLKIIDFGSVTQTPPKEFDKPGAIGGGRKPLVATPVYAPAELREPQVNGRYCYPWYSFDAYSAASTFVEMLSTHTWTELLMWQCYIKTYDDLKARRGIKQPLDQAIQQCSNSMHGILWKAQPQVEDIDPELETDYWGKAAIQRLRRLIKIAAVTQGHYNRRVADGRSGDARNRYYDDMYRTMSASEEDLDSELESLLPKRRALIKEIFDDYRSSESTLSNSTTKMRTFALNIIYSLSPYASERTAPEWFIGSNDRSNRLSDDFATPQDSHFKAKVIPCESVVIDSCILPIYLGGSECPAHSSCVQTEDGAMGGLSKKCLCDTGYCVVDGECVLSDPPVLFEKHDGGNAVWSYNQNVSQAVLEVGDRLIGTDKVENCEQLAAQKEAYLYTYFSQSYPKEDLRGLCVIWSYDIAATHNRLFAWLWDFSQGTLADGGVATGVNVELYVPETKPVLQEGADVNVAGEVYAMKNGFRGAPRGHDRYRVRTKQVQKVVGYRQKL